MKAILEIKLDFLGYPNYFTWKYKEGVSQK